MEFKYQNFLLLNFSLPKCGVVGTQQVAYIRESVKQNELPSEFQMKVNLSTQI